MKQHITKEIVNTELNDIQRSRLKCSLEDIGGWDGSFVEDPGLSIGQMIEFLGEHKKDSLDLQIYWFEGDVRLSGAVPNLGIKSSNQPGIKDGHAVITEKSLVNALWEAVKHALNETK